MNRDPRTIGAQFDAIYGQAGGDARAVPWARQAPHPLLIEWLQPRTRPSQGARAIVIGCGLGDDAEALAHAGYRVTAIDIAPTAVDWCQQRFPNSPVTYLVQDLFDTPDPWQRSFDLVLESRTLQALPDEIRPEAMRSIANLVAVGGTALIICLGREPHELFEGTPQPLTHAELDMFQQAGLIEIAFDDVSGTEGRSVRHFRVEFQRSPASA